MLNVLLWAPLAAGVVVLVAPRAASRWIGVVGALVAVGVAIGAIGLRSRRRRPVPPSTSLDLRPRGRLRARGRRDQRLPGPADRGPLGRRDRVRGPARLSRGRPLAALLLLLALGETAALGAFLAQDLLLFVLFFDLMLIPFFFLIGSSAAASGSRRRRR